MARGSSVVLALLLGCSAEVSLPDGAPPAAADAGVTDAGALPDGGPEWDAGSRLDSGAGQADASTAGADASQAPGRCAPLPAPTGKVVQVTPAQASELAALVQAAAPGDTLLLADGTYRPTSADEGQRRLQFLKPGVTLRSASGNRDAVILDGEYKTAEMVFIAASDVTIADLTITRAVDHPVHVTGGASGDVTGVRLYNLHIVDGGEQQVKVNGNGTTPRRFADDGRLECSLVELTAAGRGHVESLGGTSCYTGGIDAHQARGWIVRDNAFRGIYCPGGPLAEHAVHFWSGSRDTLVERNAIVDCARGIGFGLTETGTSRDYPDNPAPGLFVGHFGGLIRNNFVAATIAEFDTGIELDQARGTKVFHNTVFHPTTAFSSLDYRFANTQVEVRNNVLVRVTRRNEAQGAVADNLLDAKAALFRAPATWDLRLVAGAATAIDQAAALADHGLDIDGRPHAVGPPDLGAHEYGAQ